MSQIELAPGRSCALCESVSTGLYGRFSYTGTLHRVSLLGFSLPSSLSSGLCACQRKGPPLLFLRSGCFVLWESKVSRLDADVTD